MLSGVSEGEMLRFRTEDRDIPAALQSKSQAREVDWKRADKIAVPVDLGAFILGASILQLLCGWHNAGTPRPSRPMLQLRRAQ